MNCCEKRAILEVHANPYRFSGRGGALRTNTVFLLGWVVLAVAFATGCTINAQTSGASEKDRAQLEIKGSPGSEFSGSCTVGDKEREQISGQVPESFTYDLEGRPLDCKISSEGELQVELSVGENVRSVQRISGGTLNLAYENGSISSSSSSSGSSQATSSSAGRVDEEVSDTTNDSSNVTSESRNVSDFDEVELQGVGNLSIEQTGSDSLTVEAEEDVLPKIRTEVENNRLIIGPKPDTTLHTTEPISYKLTVEELNALKVSGSGDVDAEDISTDKLAITISGAGEVKISGKTNSQDIDISGAGEYRAEDLESKEVKIDVGGSGSAIVNVTERLEAEVSGSGSVEYIGDPAVDQDVSGAGDVSKH